jgi:hypothetical protein
VTVTLSTPDEYSARVVMLGDTYAHVDDINADFLKWVRAERILKPHQIIVEWLERNPLAHNDPKYAPVGNYMSTFMDEDIRLVARA